MRLPRGHPEFGLRAYNDRLFICRSFYGAADTIFTNIYCLSTEPDSLIWERLLIPRRRDGGGTVFSISTQNDIIWITTLDYLYLLNKDDGELLVRLELPTTTTWEHSLFFPITYKNYLISGHRDFVYVYKADTISGIEDKNTQPTSISSYQFYHYFESNNVVFSLYLPIDNNISIKLYDIKGNLIKNIYTGFLTNGRHTFHFNTNQLSSGVYFSTLETLYKNYKKAIKIFIVK